MTRTDCDNVFCRATIYYFGKHAYQSDTNSLIYLARTDQSFLDWPLWISWLRDMNRSESIARAKVVWWEQKFFSKRYKKLRLRSSWVWVIVCLTFYVNWKYNERYGVRFQPPIYSCFYEVLIQKLSTMSHLPYLAAVRNVFRMGNRGKHWWVSVQPYVEEFNRR